MNHSESEAKRVLEEIFPGSNLEYRATQSNGEYDFDWHRSDGTIAAVEVTAAVDETLMETVAAIQGKRARGSTIPAVFCKKSWLIFPANGASIPTIRKNADGYLAKLEDEGIDSFSCFNNSPIIQDMCCHLLVTEGWVISTPNEPTIQIQFPPGGDPIGAAFAVKAAEREAWKSDNRTKLGNSQKDERHLVVYFDARWPSALTALTDPSFFPPPMLPTIPAEITNLWLIGRGQKTNEFVIWFATTHTAWQCARIELRP